MPSPGILRALLVAVVLPLSLAALFQPGSALAHPELERASPAPDAILGAPPRHIELWMTEAVATGAGSPSLSVLDEAGNALPVSDLRVDPADARRITAEVSGVGHGTFTVAWTARSDVDGHTLTGTYAFRVGGTNRAPAAATVEGQKPPAWAVATRWLTFLGAGTAAAGLLFGRAIVRGPHPDVAATRRLRIAALAAAIAATATLAEPLLQTLAPPAGVIAPSFSDAGRGLPDAWFLRAPGLAAAALVAAVSLALPRRDRTPLALAGAAAALLALLGLALTSHASARESLRLPALASVIIHQWTVALWTGGIVALLISRPRLTEIEAAPWLRRFSRSALALAAAGIGTGVVNAGLMLPNRAALLDSDYGRVIVIKALLVLVALALAALHRTAIHRAVAIARAAMPRTVPVEAILLAAIVLGGSVLALLAPPPVARGLVERVDLAAPLASAGANEPHARLVIDPAAQGGNDIGVAVTAGQPVRFGAGGSLESAPLVKNVVLVRLSVTNLERQTAPTIVTLEPAADGWFRVEGLALGLDGWWRAEALIRRPGVEDVTVPFYFILPDPNVHGEGAVNIPAGDPAARALFQSGLIGITSLRSVHFVERLGGGTGTVVVSRHTVHDGSDPNQPAALRIATDRFEMIRSGGLQWVREPGEDWTRTDSNPVIGPSSWGVDYQNAVGFRLAGQELIGDRTATLITFFVPGDRLAPAWYGWWIEAGTGRVLREVMISRGHYMLREFEAFDSAPPVIPPD